jgi:uncharacterized membrane protein YsdA (DUF1294 family)
MASARQGSRALLMSQFLIVYLAWLVILNVVTAMAYARDKRAARQSCRRVPERTLFLLNLAGGVISAWLVFFGMRHKTRHCSFWPVQSTCSLLHLGALVLLLAGFE